MANHSFSVFFNEAIRYYNEKNVNSHYKWRVLGCRQQ